MASLSRSSATYPSLAPFAWLRRAFAGIGRALLWVSLTALFGAVEGLIVASEFVRRAGRRLSADRAATASR